MSFDQKVVIDSAVVEWQQSPRAGVWRKPLAREEAERGHATSIVRYEAGASFSVHDHPLGEEILVLEGVFSDETGDYKAGTYFRNPEGFRHAPFSNEGCIILVKLHQFLTEDTSRISIDTQYFDSQIAELILHKFKTETVSIVHLSKGNKLRVPIGLRSQEIFIMSGQLADDEQTYVAGTWMRLPDIGDFSALVETKIWMKTGHF